MRSVSPSKAIPQAAVLATAEELQPLDRSTGNQASAYLRLLGGLLSCGDQCHRPADDLLRRVPEQPLGGRVPTRDHPVGGRAEDGVSRPGDDGGKPAQRLLCLLALGEIDRCGDDGNHCSVWAEHRGVGDMHRQPRPVPPPDPVLARPGLPLEHTCDDGVTLIRRLAGGDEVADWLSDGLGAGPPVQPFCGPVPVEDDPRPVGGDDRVADRLEYGVLELARGRICARRERNTVHHGSPRPMSAFVTDR